MRGRGENPLGWAADTPSVGKLCAGTGRGRGPVVYVAECLHASSPSSNPTQLMASAPHFIGQATGLKVIGCLARRGQSGDSYRQCFGCQRTYIFLPIEILFIPQSLPSSPG